MNHPSPADLALYAGGDVGLLERWRLKRHASRCAECTAEVEAFRRAFIDLQMDAAAVPAGLNWDRLAAEMTANIHVGLEAAECVGPLRERTPRTGWRAAAVMAAMSILVLAAWFLNPPPRATQRARVAPGVEIRTTNTGLELNENGSALVLLHGRGYQARKPMIVSSPGTLRARFVDEETGQITINNVYSE